MQKFRKILHALFYPHLAVLICFVCISVNLLIYSFASPAMPMWLHYLAYIMSAYSLACMCLRIPLMVRDIKRFSATNKFAQLLVSSPVYRVRIMLYLSLFFNICYAAVQFALALTSKSNWYVTLTIYYCLLVALRVMLLVFMGQIGGEDKQSKLLEWRLYGISGIMLALMNMALNVMVFFIVWKNKGFSHYYVVTIALGAYTFLALTLAIVNIIRYRRFNSPVMSACKAISLVCALVSLLSLETAMLASFGGDMSEHSRYLLTVVTGMLICWFIFGMSIYMSSRAIKNIKQLRKEIEADSKKQRKTNSTRRTAKTSKGKAKSKKTASNKKR